MMDFRSRKEKTIDERDLIEECQILRERVKQCLDENQTLKDENAAINGRMSDLLDSFNDLRAIMENARQELLENNKAMADMISVSFENQSAAVQSHKSEIDKRLSMARAAAGIGE